MISSYPDIFNLGHRAVEDLLKGPVYVEEKVDGSQMSMQLTLNVGLEFRSKGQQIHPEAPPQQFGKAIEYISQLAYKLTPRWVYRGECITKPKHNVLAYDRTPTGCFIVYDIQTGEETYLPPDLKANECRRIGLECVPLLYEGRITEMAQLDKLLDTKSILGGQKIEGVVIKPVGYNLYGRDKKCLMGKYVSPEFREIHNRTWVKENKPATHNAIIQLIGAAYATEARWNKAIQHLRDADKLLNAPEDIGLLMKEIPADIRKECEQDIKDVLFRWAWPQIQRIVTKPVPEWYKAKVAVKQFEQEVTV